MTIDPKTALWLNLILTICSALAGLGWATVFDAKIASVVTFSLLAVSSILNGVLHAYSAPEKGPLVK